MGLAETAQLVARLDLGGNFLSQVSKVDKSLGGLDRSVSKMGDRWYKAGAQVGTGIKNGVALGIGAIGIIGANVAVGLRSLEKLEVLTAQTSAVIKSTGGVAGITGAKVEELSKKYEALGGVIDDKVIQNSENLLLTFTNVRKNAFEPALKAILDMNTAMGGGEEGLQHNTILVGKALQDPVRGLTALRRVGVQFTKDQEKQIAALVKTGDVMGAQKIIIGELDREFGGSFLAKGDTRAGKIGRFREAIESLQEALAKALLPTIGKVADKLAAFLSAPGTVGAIERLGGQIAGLFSDANIAKGADALKSAFGVVQGILPALKDAASVSGQVLSTAVGLFKSLPPELQKLAIGALAVNKLTGGLVTNVVGGIVGLALNQLKTITAANVTVIGGNVAGGAPGAAGAAAGGAAGLAAKAFGLTAAAALVVAIAVPLGEAVRGAFGVKAGDGPKTIAEAGGFKLQVNGQSQAQEARQRAAVAENGKTVRTLADAIIKAGGLSPDERQVANEQTRATNRVYDALERNRLAKQAINVYVTTSLSVSVRDQAIKTKTALKYGKVAS